MRSQEPPVSCSERASWAAAREGQLDALKWMRSQDPPFACDSDTCEHAAEGGHLEVLRWLTGEGCPWNMGKCRATAERGGHTGVVNWIDRVAAGVGAAEAGKLDELKILRSQDPSGAAWTHDMCTAAAKRRHLEVLVDREAKTRRARGPLICA